MPNYIITTCGQSNDQGAHVSTPYTRAKTGTKMWGYASGGWEDMADPMTLEAARGASYRPNLSHYLRGKYTGLELGIVTSSIAGTSLSVIWSDNTNEHYINFVLRTLAAGTPNIVIYVGCEADIIAGESAATIETKALLLVSNMRTSFSNPTLKVFFTAPYDSTRVAASAVVKTGLENAALADSNVYLMADLADYEHIDTVHISKTGQDLLGTAMGVYLDGVLDFSEFTLPIPLNSQYFTAKYLDSPYYIKVSIDSDKIPSDQTYVPLVIGESHLPPRFWENMAYSDGRDMVVTDTSGNKFDIEKVAIDRTAKTMTIWAKFNELLSSTDAEFLIQFGGEINEVSTVNTWKNCYDGSTDYGVVIHGEETSGNFSDSLGVFTGTAANLANYAQVGKINKCPEFNGDSSVIDFGRMTNIEAVEKLSFLAWLEQDLIDQSDFVFFYQVDSTKHINIQSSTGGTGTLFFQVSNGALARYSVDYVDDGYLATVKEMFGFVFDGSLAAANRPSIYMGGSKLSGSVTSGTFPTTTPELPAVTASMGRTVNSFDGKIDEFRIIIGALTADQQTIHYNNESTFSTNNIFTFGDVEKFNNQRIKYPSEVVLF